MNIPELVDYSSMNPPEFWALVDKQAEISKKKVAKLFYRAGTSETFNSADAIDCLNHLFIDSHRRLREAYSELVDFYPTKHLIVNSLKNTEDLWWVDHTTSHISNASILHWFSNEESLSGFSTHFLVGYTGLPFHLVPLMHGAVHEPHRNNDSIAVSVMNAGGLTKNKEKWKFWGGDLPQNLIVDLPPVRLSAPYKGYSAIQPFTTDQIKNVIILKRIVATALRSKIHISRFTQHSDWSDTGVDMGPLWPYESVNNATFENFPVEEYDFVQRYDSTITNESFTTSDHSMGNSLNVQNPEFCISEISVVPPIEEIQLALCKVGIKIKIDNHYDSTTKNALQKFQTTWNQTHPNDLLDPNGIPDTKTCKRLVQEGR